MAERSSALQGHKSS
ncbi:hypothetical protein WJX75_001208 [Coccomyxa subellipsoidea]|uniref:Uncharacterized protein n=1 Tax=Coccomyxa subellipsoidea TaxID=248742 RepID=A0ABR2YNY7_9CHLO